MIVLADVHITIYKVTGNQLFFKVPEKVCQECDILVNVIRRVVDDINDSRISVEIKPWMNNLLSSIAKGGIHPPVLLVNSQIFSQGMVPNAKDLEERIMQELAK